MGQKLKQAVPVTNIDMMKQLCCVIDAHLPLDIIDPVDIEYLYIFSVIWSLGAVLTGSARIKIDGNPFLSIQYFDTIFKAFSYLLSTFLCPLPFFDSF